MRCVQTVNLDVGRSESGTVLVFTVQPLIRSDQVLTNESNVLPVNATMLRAVGDTAELTEHRRGFDSWPLIRRIVNGCKANQTTSPNEK
jgi:hypothetical protein